MFPCPAGCVLSLGRKRQHSLSSCVSTYVHLNPAKVDRSLEHTTIWHTHTHSHTHTHIYIYIYMGNVAHALSSFPLFPGSAAGAAALKSGQGPPGRGIAVGGSLLSVGERGGTPCCRPPGVAKNHRVLQCFVLFPLFATFRILWLKMGQHGPT